MLVPPRAPEGGAERQVSPSRHWPRRSPALTQPARRAVAPGGGRPPGARHRPPAQGWVTAPDHHAALWADTLAVERRPLAVYEEVTTWN